MAVLLACPNGHQWEVADGPTVTAGEPQRCPVCGAEVAAPVRAAPGTEEAETLTGRPEAELGSVAPGPAVTVVPAVAFPTLSGYEILGELGRGGMGVVYQARHTQLDRLVAIKMLPAQVGNDPQFVERFTREARALARLSHPAIITVHDFGQEGDQYYFVMEFVAGTDLRQRMRSGRLAPAEVFRIVSQVCDALQYAHDEGIVHRDIKPENILLDQRDRIKIADFGIAKLLTHNTGQYTLTGPMQMIGTWRYMAPEQLDDPLRLDHRADIYSLGVVLYEMLTGKLPVGQFPPPSQLSQVDRRIDELVLRALQPEPDQRFQKVSELKAALEEPGRAETVRAPDATAPPERKPATEPTATSISEQASEIPRELRAKANSASWALLISGVLNLLAAAPGTVFVIFYLVLSLREQSVHLEGWEIAWAIALLHFGVSAYLGLLGGFLLRGAYLAKLGHYRSAMLYSVVAMLPLSPLWPITFGLGLWSRTKLRDPQVERAFELQCAWDAKHPRPPGPIRRLLAHSTFWVLLLCVGGIAFCLQPALPWCKLVLVGDKEVRTLAAAYGYMAYEGIGPAALLLIYCLMLIVAGFRDRVALWEPLARMVVGMVVLLVAAITIIEINDGKPSIETSDPDLPAFLKNASGFGIPLGGVPTGPSHGSINATMLHRRYTIPVEFNVNGVRVDVASSSANRGDYVWIQSLSSPANLIDRVKVQIVPVYIVAAVGLALLLLGAVQLRGVLQRPRRSAIDG